MQCCSQVRLYEARNYGRNPPNPVGWNARRIAPQTTLRAVCFLYVGGEIIADPKLAVLEPCERKIERQMMRWRVCRRTARYDRYRPGPRRARRCREIHRSPPASPQCSPLQAASAAAPGNGMSASSPTLVPRHLARAWFCELATGRARSLFSATRVRQQQVPLRREQHSSFAASVWLELPTIADAVRRSTAPESSKLSMTLQHPYQDRHSTPDPNSSCEK